MNYSKTFLLFLTAIFSVFCYNPIVINSHSELAKLYPGKWFRLKWSSTCSTSKKVFVELANQDKNQIYYFGVHPSFGMFPSLVFKFPETIVPGRYRFLVYVGDKTNRPVDIHSYGPGVSHQAIIHSESEDYLSQGEDESEQGENESEQGEDDFSQEGGESEQGEDAFDYHKKLLFKTKKNKKCFYKANQACLYEKSNKNIHVHCFHKATYSQGEVTINWTYPNGVGINGYNYAKINTFVLSKEPNQQSWSTYEQVIFEQPSTITSWRGTLKKVGGRYTRYYVYVGVSGRPYEEFNGVGFNASGTLSGPFFL